MSFNLATGGGETNLPDHYQSSSNHNNSGNSSSRDNGNNNNTENNTGSSNSSSSQSQNQRQAHKSRNPPKLGACTECHKSKNKCVFSKEAQDFFNQVLALHDANSSTSGNTGTNSNDDGDDDDDGNSTNNDGNNVVAILQGLDPSLRPRCERCARLNKECLPHISRQGKRRKNRKDKDAAQSASSSSSSSGKKKVDDGAGDGDEEKTSRVAASGSDGSSGNGFEGFDSNSSSNRDSNVLTGSFNSTVQNNNIGRDRSVSVEFNNLLAALRRKQSQNQSQQQQNTSVQNQNFSQQQQQQQQQLQQLQQLQQQQQQQRLQQLQQLQQQRHHDFQPPQAQDNPLPNNNDFSQRYQSMLPSYPHHASNATTTNNNNSNNSQEESIRILLNQINNGNRNNNNNSIMNGNYNGDIPSAVNGLGTGPIPSRAHSAGNIHRGSMGSDSGINHNSNSSIQMPHGGRIHSNTAVGKGLDHRSIAGNNDWMQGNSYGMGNNSIINNNENLDNLGLVSSALDMNRRQSSGRSSTDYNNSSYDDNNNNNNNNATTNNINNNNNKTDTLSNNKNAIMPGSVSNALLLLARRGSDVSSSLGVDVANGSGTPTISNYSNNLHGSNNIMSNYDSMSLVLKDYLSKVTNSKYNNSNGNITSNNIKDGNVNDNINSANDSGSKNNSSVGSLGRHGYIRTNSNGNAHISSRSNTANDALNADCGTSLGHLLPTKTHSSTADDDNHVEFDCNVLPYKKQKRPRLSAVDEEATCKRGASQNRSSSRGASALPSSDSCCAGDGNGQNDVGESCIKHESIEGESLSRSSSSVFVGPEDTIGNAITKACAKNAGKSLTSLKYHYGLQCQIREWISMALVRRSFALLGKASTLANRCGIHMDRILCGIPEEEDHENNQDSYKPERHKNIGRRMNYLLAELLEPRSQQKIPLLERHMLSPRLSSDVLAMVGCQSCPTFQEQEMRNRWIIIRETHCGKSSFYCSPAFEQNVLCWSHISQIYEDNLADINSLIFVRDDFRRLIACVAQQLSSHSVEGMPPRPVHAPKTTVRLLSRQLSQSNCGAKDVVRKARGNDVMTLEMDLLVILIPTMDKTTYYLELFHRSCDEDGDDYLIDAKNQSSRRASNNINAGDDSPFKKSGMGDVQKDDSNPPTFDDVVESEEWVGIDDVLASGDIDDLITALCD